MLRRLRSQSPALPLAFLALFIALGGGVYAASRIDGHSIKPRSLPGNRLEPNSVPGNRLRAGTVPGNRLRPGSVTGAQLDAATLGQVPSAAHAESAATAREAGTALSATRAANAERLNGFSAGCGAGTRPFAGTCWALQHSEAPLTAPAAAASCAEQGGELPPALALAAYSQQPGIVLAVGGEWTSDLTNASGLDAYSVFTVSPSGQIGFLIFSATMNFRCVLPLVS